MNEEQGCDGLSVIFPTAVSILSPTEHQSIRGLPCAEAHLGSCISVKGLSEGGICEGKDDPTSCRREAQEPKGHVAQQSGTKSSLGKVRSTRMTS